MKKIAIYLLLFLILFQCGLAFWMNQAGISLNRLHMFHSAMHTYKEVQLKISIADYNRHNIKGKELAWGGMMYEIKSLTVKDGEVMLQLIPDKMESMIKKFGQVIEGNQHKLPEKGNSISSLLLILTFGLYDAPVYNEMPLFSCIHHSFFPDLNFSVQDFSFRFFTPPEF